MPNILESYLVSIGFTSDEPSFRKFNNLMAEVEHAVTDHTSGIAKRIVEAQGTITGMFTAVSVGIIGLVDKVAMQDQAYRLLGLRMLMTTESARKMDIVTKTLGADLGQIFWDRELRERAGILIQDIDRWTKALGPDFEARMKGIRDIRFEFSRLQVAMQFLGMSFTSQLFQKLGLGDVFSKLKSFVDGIDAGKIQHWADVLSDKAVPILKETWVILQGLERVSAAAGVAFTNFIGLLSGDQSIQGTTFSFNNLLKAVEHIEHGFEKFLDYVTQAETLLAHFASAVTLMFSGKFAEAKDEFLAGIKQMSAGSGAVIGGVLGSPFGPGGIAAGAAVGGFLGHEAAEQTAAGTFTQQAYRTPGLPELPVGLPQRDADIINSGLPGSNYQFEKYRTWAREHLGIGAARDDSHSFDLDRARMPAFFGALLGGLTGNAVNIGTMAASGALFSDPDQNKKYIANLPEASREGLWPWQLRAQQSETSDTYTHTDLVRAIEAASAKYNVPRELALAVAKEESGIRQYDSGGNLVKNSNSSATGVMQLTRATAETLGVDATDALQNIDGGVRYLSQLLKRYGGDQTKALQGYAVGPTAGDKVRGPEDLPSDMRNYIPRVLQFEKEFAKQSLLPTTPDVSVIQHFERNPTTAPDYAPPANVSPNVGDIAAGRVKLTDPSKTNDALDALNASQRVYAGIRDDQAVASAQQLPQQAPTTVTNSHEQTLTVRVGDINIMQPGADAHQIKRSVTDGIRDALLGQTQFDIVQLAPNF